MTDARTFIKALEGDSDAAVTFQTFDDNSKRKRKDLARVLHGSLSEHGPMLAELNSHGAGVYVCVNQTNGAGRKERNVVRLRALFVDADNVNLPEAWPIEPSMIVQSRRGQHAYWLIHPDEPLEVFTGAQKHLAAALGTDPAVSDLPRVMRLPGFMHRKSDPYPVKLVHCEPENIYAVWEVLRAFPLPLPMARK